MDGIFYGVLFLGYGLLLLFFFFFSSKEKRNMLGNKSLQQNLHKEIRKWTNQCFGLFAIVGAVVGFKLFLINRIVQISP